jgi:hypothetical protein
MRKAPSTTSVNYEAVQNWNFLTTWLHSFRYKHALDALAAFREPFTMIDIGCATAKLYGLIDARQAVNYTGIELYPSLAAQAQERYGGRANFRVIQGSAMDLLPTMQADVVVALETFEHILERDVVTLVDRIAAMKPKLLIVSVPVEIGPAILMKNLGSLLAGYGRHREYGFAHTVAATFNQLDRLPPHGSSHIGFDWRWLAQTIRHRFKITEMRRFPLSFAPVSCSASVFMICRPWTETERPRVT